MARILIQHPDGDPTHRVSVPEEAHARLYPDWTPVKAEEPSDFTLVGIPKPKEGRRAPKAKNAKPIDKAIDEEEAS